MHEVGADLIGTQLTSAAVVVYLLQKIKQARWIPWVREQTRALNQALAIMAAGATAIGIHWTFDPAAGALTITGLTLSGLTHGTWEWIKQVAIQQVLYDGVIEPKRHRSEA